jgi:hypothetical protein
LILYIGPGSLPVGGNKKVVDTAINKAVVTVKTSPAGIVVYIIKLFGSHATLN